MATIRKDIDALDDLEQLRAQVAEQQQRLEMLEARQDPTPDGVGAKKDKVATRRQLLKLAGATLVGAAGSAALRAIPASAANGDPLVVGTIATQDLNNTSGLALTGTAAPGRAFEVVAQNVGGQTALAGFGSSRGVYGYAPSQGVYGFSYSGIGVYGYAYTTGGIGVRGGGDVGVQAFGYSFYGTQHTGVFGAGSSFGVLGQSSTGIGVKATSSLVAGSALFAYTGATQAIAVNASSLNGAANVGFGGPGFVASLFASDIGVRAFGSGAFPAVQAISYTGPDLQARGSGRLNQVANISGGIGAPNFTPSPGYFEMVRAKDGTMWVNRGTGALKASWKRVNAVRVDSSDGTGAPFKPVRVIDTRSGAIKAANSMTLVAVAGFGSGTSNIPADAVAVIGNLTAVAYTGSGFLSVMPGGIVQGEGAGQYDSDTDPSSVNFIVGQKAIANSFISGLGTGANAGKLQVFVAGHSSHFIIDITGYMQ